MENHNKMVSLIWSVADDCLRDVYNKGKYRDVILPMVVLRRLDALLEDTKEKVLEEYKSNKELGLEEDEESLYLISNHKYFNISEWTMQKLVNSASNDPEQLRMRVEEYLDGYSENIKEIITKFKLRQQIEFMAEKNILLEVLQKFTDPELNLTPFDKELNDGTVLTGVSNLGMGYIFEELIRKFNEENNEEAGEHFTPREVIELMTHIVFEPIADKLAPVTTIYDPACGSGGMLTESEQFITDPQGKIKSKTDVNLYGKEINDETYAICKSDMIIKDNNPEGIKSGSTLSTNEFEGMKFDFMLSNPPYGKSWATEQKNIKDGKNVIDNRFIVELTDFWGNKSEVEAIPASSDGQLLFMMEMVTKMKPANLTETGSRIASVHNGSSLFTGDAGSGASNIRRYIIENDLLDAIIQLPNNLFYNTGITTYIWILSNKKPKERVGKVLLIDANKSFKKLRKSLGQKNCEITKQQVDEIVEMYNEMTNIDKEQLSSKVFNNEDFGYYKVKVQRPNRLRVDFTQENIEKLKLIPKYEKESEYLISLYSDNILTKLKDDSEEVIEKLQFKFENLQKKDIKVLLDLKKWNDQLLLFDIADQILNKIDISNELDFNVFKEEMDSVIKELGIKVTTTQKNKIYNVITEYDENAEKVIKKVVKKTKKEINNLMLYNKCQEDELKYYGYNIVDNNIVEYEEAKGMDDDEIIPLSDNITEYFKKEVLKYVSDAWIDLSKIKIGYEISFNKYFYKPEKLRSLNEIAKELLELEEESKGLLEDLLGGYNNEKI